MICWNRFERSFGIILPVALGYKHWRIPGHRSTVTLSFYANHSELLDAELFQSKKLAATFTADQKLRFCTK